ncbi:hypothetical protein [Thermovibrio ammonificans]
MAYATQEDLLRYEPSITDYVPQGQEDFSPQIILAEAQINLTLKAKGIDPESVPPDELKTLTCLKALYLIFNMSSRDKEDIFYAKAQSYKEAFEEAIQNILVINDEGETVSTSGGYVGRG